MTGRPHLRLVRGGLVDEPEAPLLPAPRRPGERGWAVAHDAQLLAAAARGHRHAWDVLVDRYADVVWSCARAVAVDDAQAADVSAGVWLLLAQQLPALDVGRDLVVWLVAATAQEAAAVG